VLPFVGGEEEDDAAKIAYIKEALKDNGEFRCKRELSADLLAAIDWCSGKSPQVIMDQREGAIRAIEQLAAKFKADGVDRRWCVCAILGVLRGFVCLTYCVRREKIADPEVRRIVRGVNGPLLEFLAEKANYCDKAAVELFRTGAPVIGVLDRCASH